MKNHSIQLYEFYDTNVVSFLCDYLQEDKEKVAEFLSGKHILLTNRVMNELKVRPNADKMLEDILEIGLFYLINPDLLIYKEYLHTASGKRGAYKIFPVRFDSLLMDISNNAQRAIGLPDKEVKKAMEERYGEKMKAQVGRMYSETTLRASINVKIIKELESLGYTPDLTQLKYKNFPAKFTFEYIWWLRYPN